MKLNPLSLKRGGVDITASADRLYLLGSKEVVASGKKDLNTYNDTTYMESGDMFISGDKVLTTGNTTKKQSSMMVAGFLQNSGTTAVIAPDGFHYNTDYVQSISYYKENGGIGLSITYKTVTLASKYCRMLMLTPTIQQGDVTSENYLACTYYNRRESNKCIYVLFMYDTNNGANLKESPFGLSVFVPNAENEY